MGDGADFRRVRKARDERLREIASTYSRRQRKIAHEKHVKSSSMNFAQLPANTERAFIRMSV